MEYQYAKTIICGSPRDNGRSMSFAEGLFEEAIANFPENEHALISLADMEISGCVGCDSCKDSGECIFFDDMPDIIDYIENSEELIIVSPVYMAGVPSQLKALLDRLQPFFWTDARHEEKRKAIVHLFGEGHDPYGTKGAELSIKSALHLAGFEVEEVELHIN